MTAQAKPLPICKAILICEKVVPDNAGNVNILGVRNRFRLAGFPGVQRQLKSAGDDN